MIKVVVWVDGPSDSWIAISDGKGPSQAKPSTQVLNTLNPHKSSGCTSHMITHEKQGGNQACNLLVLPTRSPWAGRRLHSFYLQHFAMFYFLAWLVTNILQFLFPHIYEGHVLVWRYRVVAGTFKCGQYTTEMRDESWSLDHPSLHPQQNQKNLK